MLTCFHLKRNLCDYLSLCWFDRWLGSTIYSGRLHTQRRIEAKREVAWRGRNPFSLSGRGVATGVSIIPSKNNCGGILILRNSVFNGISRNFTEFRNLFRRESNNSVTFRLNSVVRSSAGHSSWKYVYSIAPPLISDNNL